MSYKKSNMSLLIKAHLTPINGGGVRKIVHPSLQIFCGAHPAAIMCVVLKVVPSYSAIFTANLCPSNLKARDLCVAVPYKILNRDGSVTEMMWDFAGVDPGNAGADPSNPQTWNGYAYVSNNPLTYTDQKGEGIFGVLGSIIGSFFPGLGNLIGCGIGSIADLATEQSISPPRRDRNRQRDFRQHRGQRE